MSGTSDEQADRCWTSTRESLVCRSEPDEHGVQVNKCERTRQVLRHCAGRPDEVIESSREVTDGKPLEAIDGAFMRPLFGEARARDFSDALSGFSDMMRVAEKMQRAVTELLPELEEAMPRFGGERGLQSRSALPRGSDGGEEAKKKKPPPPPQSTSYDEV